MYKKVWKLIYKTWEKYFIYVFLAVFLSLFSFILWNNIVLSVKDYLQSQIKPLVWWDIVLSSRIDLDENYFRNTYSSTFEISKTISLNSTLFNNYNKSELVEIVYHTVNFPFYNQFEYDVINQNWHLIVNQKTYENYWDIIEIFWDKFLVKWIIKKSLFDDISIYTTENKLYIPIDKFNNSLNSTNSRLNYKYYLIFKWKYDEKFKEILKNDIFIKDFRIRTLNDRNDNIWNITDRFYVFINFFNLLIFVLTFFIIILSLEIFFKKIKWTIWLLNIFWLKKHNIFYYNFLVLFVIFISSFLLAYVLNIILMEILSLKYSFFSSKIQSFYKWFIISIILLFVWFFLPFYKIFKSDISSLIKDENNFSNFTFKDYILYLLIIFIGFLLINFISWINIINSFLYSFLFILFIAIFYIFIEFILKLLFSIYKFKLKNFYYFDAIRSTIKPWNVSFLIVFSSIISFISIFIFYVFSWSFLNYLNNITSNSNDTFVLNVVKEDLQNVKKYFNNDEVFEIVTLKIKNINWLSLEKFLNTDSIPRQFWREFSSTTNVLDNKLISWKELVRNWVSVDKEFANELWLKLWDQIVFTVAWLEKTLKVVNFREAVRNWTNPFFYFQLFPDDFKNYPKNYILSYKEVSKPSNIENILFKEIWSHLTFIKTKEIIDIVIKITKQILVVVYFCLIYIFVFSFLSFIVSIKFLSTFKLYKIKILGILWWNYINLIKSFNFEFIYLIFIWLFFSFIFWLIILLVVFYFIKYFSLNLFSLLTWTILILFLFLIMISYLKIFKIFK